MLYLPHNCCNLVNICFLNMQDCQVLVREPYSDRDSTWTGLGFMRVFEGSHLEFDVTDIPQSLEYDIVVRYEPQVIIIFYI